MAATFNVLLLIFALKSSTCSSVEQLPVESRLEQLELGAEVQFERTNDLRQRLSVLERVVTKMVSSNNSSQKNNSSLKTEETGQLLRNISQVETNYSMPILPLTGALRQLAGPKVNFHAYLSATRPFYPEQTVIFDRVETNEGAGYSYTDGTFDPPYSGTYVFTWTITAQKFAHPVTTHLIVDGNVKGIQTSESDYSTTNAAGTGSHPATAVVVTHVDAGRHVSIRVKYPAGGTSSIQSNQISRSTFSGWLL